MRALLPLLLVGCGDPLLGAARLDQLFPDLEPPDDPHLRWSWLPQLDGPLRASCELLPVEPLEQVQDAGLIVIDKPEAPAPTAWIDVGEARVAIGIPLVQEGEAADPTTALWGVSDEQVFVRVEGDPAAAEEALGVVAWEGYGLVEGAQWTVAFDDGFGEATLEGRIFPDPAAEEQPAIAVYQLAVAYPYAVGLVETLDGGCE